MKARDVIVGRKTTNEEGSGIVAGGKKLIGKKLVPALGFTDAAMRAHEGDWVGAGIGTVAGGLGLVPPVTPVGIAAQAGSVGLDAVNQLRDYAKEKGGWSNLGKEWYKSIEDQQYDPSFLPEEFDHLQQLEEQGILDEAGLRSWLVQKGMDAAEWLRNLRKAKPEVPPSTVEPPKPPTVPKKDTGPIDIEKEFERIRAEREAAANAEEAAKAAAEAERLKNLELPKQGRLESDKKYLQRLEKMGPEYAAKHRQEIDTLAKMRDLEVNAPKSLPKEIGKKVLRGAGWGAGAAGAIKYGPKVVDWALDKGIENIKDIDTTGAKLPFPVEPTPAPAPAPAPSNTDTSADKPADSSDTPASTPAPVTEPAERPGRKEFGDQSKTTDKQEPLAEKEEQYSKKQYIAWAAKYAKLYDVPLPVVLHAMRKETGNYDADTAATIRGPKTRYGQAVGVMQLMPTFFKTLKPEDFTNPEKNIEAGTRFLAKLYNTYGTPEAALAAYNAGPNSPAFNNWLKSQNPRDLPVQTREYVYGNPKKKTVGFVNDVGQQVALLAPETTKDKIARAATDVVAAATGSGNAQAAEKTKNEVPPVNPKLVPIDDKIAKRMENLDPEFRKRLEAALAVYPGELRVTSANRLPHEQNRLYQAFISGLSKIPASKELASHSGYAVDIDRSDLAKFHRWLQAEKKQGRDYGLETGLEWPGKNQDPVHLQARNWQELQQQQVAAKKEQEKNKRQDTARIDPITGAKSAQADTTPKKDDGSFDRAEKGRLSNYPADKPAEKPAAKSKAPIEVPSVDDFGNVIEPAKIPKKSEKPADKKSDTNKDAAAVPKSDAPSLTPQKAKPDSDLSQPAQNVSPKTVPPKSERPADKKAEVGKQDPLVVPPELKDRIAKDEKKKTDSRKQAELVIPSELKDLDKDSVRKDFEQAFKAARAEKGPGNTFTWKNPKTGKEDTYTTDYEKEKPAKNKVSPSDDGSFDRAEKARLSNYPATTEKPFNPPVNQDILNALTKKDSWDTARNAAKIDIKEPPTDDKLPPVTVTAKPEKADVWRDSSGQPVTNRYGEPWGTGTSDKDDIDAARAEIQQKADAEKAKETLQSISPDLSTTPKTSLKDLWNTGIENLTGKKRMTPDELNTIRVPESVNNELADILRLAGRKK